MKHVFITGLPRSRTAWFANLLTCGDSFCYHDGFDGCETFDDFKAKLDIPYRVVGNSDPANVLFWEQIHKAYPRAVWIVINRKQNDVLESIQKVLGNEYSKCAITDYWMKLQRLEERLDPPIINFESLGKSDCRWIGQLCDIEVDDRRLDLLWNLNVQINPGHLRARMGDMKKNPTQLLKDLAA